jgi:hypothetical protein
MHASELLAPKQFGTMEMRLGDNIALTEEVEKQLVEDRMPNFRKVGSFETHLYRSSCPDHAADILPAAQQRIGVNCNLSLQQQELSDAERFLLHDATLWIDLRFSKEIDLNKVDSILLNAPGGSFERLFYDDPRGIETAMKVTTNQGRNRRIYLSHCDNPVFSEASFMNYASENWVCPEAMANTKNANEQVMLISKAVESKGLLGLNETILETPKLMVITLQAITVHLEQWGKEKKGRPPRVLISCTLGKDRTGNLSMLCQHMVGASDEDIINEYAQSHCIREVAMEKVKNYLDGKVDLSCYADCDPQTMKKTLSYLREKYGSIDDYLDAIGFSASWRQRFVNVAK